MYLEQDQINLENQITYFVNFVSNLFKIIISEAKHKYQYTADSSLCNSLGFFLSGRVYKVFGNNEQ